MNNYKSRKLLIEEFAEHGSSSNFPDSEMDLIFGDITISTCSNGNYFVIGIPNYFLINEKLTRTNYTYIECHQLSSVQDILRTTLGMNR